MFICAAQWPNAARLVNWSNVVRVWPNAQMTRRVQHVLTISDETTVMTVLPVTMMHSPGSWPVAVTTLATKTEMRMTAWILSHDTILTTCLHARHHKQVYIQHN